MKILSDIGIFSKKYRLDSLVMGTMISSFVTELAYSFINNLIMPLFNYVDINNDNKPDMKQLKKMNVTVGKRTFRIGDFLYSLIRFIIILIILVYISKIFNK